CSSGLHP
ncbi:Fatty acid metabolism regulator protein, partial [Haemophilus influenzae]